MENKEEILRALKTIQNVCREHTKCNTCPLSKNEYCVIGDQEPVDWRLREIDTWKAFED